jgi:hypothetical protein
MPQYSKSVSQQNRYTNSELSQSDQHLPRFAKAIIKLINHWRPLLKPNEYFLVEYILAHTYGKGEGKEWTRVPDILMSKSHRCESARKLEKLTLVWRRPYSQNKRQTEWKVDLDILFAGLRPQLVTGPVEQNTSSLLRRTEPGTKVRHAEQQMSGEPDQSQYSLETSFLQYNLTEVTCGKCSDSGWSPRDLTGRSILCDCLLGREIKARLFRKATQ